MKQGSVGRDRSVAIMGGDGTLGRTVSYLRQSLLVEQALSKQTCGITILPFGTGNDTAQVFGWGNSPEDESWLVDLTTLMEDIVFAKNDQLALWNVRVEFPPEKKLSVLEESKVE